MCTRCAANTATCATSGGWLAAARTGSCWATASFALRGYPAQEVTLQPRISVLDLPVPERYLDLLIFPRDHRRWPWPAEGHATSADKARARAAAQAAFDAGVYRRRTATGRDFAAVSSAAALLGDPQPAGHYLIILTGECTTDLADHTERDPAEGHRAGDGEDGTR